MDEIRYYNSKEKILYFSLKDVKKITEISFKNYNCIYKNPSTFLNFDDDIFICWSMFSVIISNLPKKLKNKKTLSMYIDFDNIHHFLNDRVTKGFNYREVFLTLK